MSEHSLFPLDLFRPTPLLTCRESSRTPGAPGGSPDGILHNGPAGLLPCCLSGLPHQEHAASAPRLGQMRTMLSLCLPLTTDWAIFCGAFSAHMVAVTGYEVAATAYLAVVKRTSGNVKANIGNTTPAAQRRVRCSCWSAARRSSSGAAQNAVCGSSSCSRICRQQHLISSLEQ